jgi:hypothetical protein
VQVDGHVEGGRGGEEVFLEGDQGWEHGGGIRGMFVDVFGAWQGDRAEWWLCPTLDGRWEGVEM